MKKMLKKLLLSLFVLAALTSFAHARLIDRGCGLIYDTTLNVTWLQDANFASTSGYDTNGMSYQKASDWSKSLKYYDSCRGIWWTGWRLPDANNKDGSGPSRGYVSGSEMGHMFYNNLGNKYNMSCSATNAIRTTFVNPDGRTVRIKNLRTNGSSSRYWSRDTYSSTRAWDLQFSCGYQRYDNRSYSYSAWPVRQGDVGELLFKDDFEDNDLDGWSMERPSDWSIKYIGGTYSRVLHTEIVPSPYHSALNDYLPPTRNYAVEADVRINSEASGGLHGVIGRATDLDNAYYFGIHANAEGVAEHWQLVKLVDGKGTHVAIKYTNETYVPNRWYKIKMSFSGDKITLYIDGKQVWSGYDSNLKGKRFGIAAMSHSDDHDNVRVTTTDPRLFSDDFSDKEASDWQPAGCANLWSVLDTGDAHGQVYDANLDPGSCLDSMYSQSLPSKDYLVESDVYIVDEIGRGGFYGVIGKAKDADNHYSCTIHSDVDDDGTELDPSYLVLKTVDGQRTELFRGYSDQITEKTWYRVGIGLQGNTISCFVDGKKIWSGTDPGTPLDGRYFGVKAHGGKIRFDNVLVTQK